jgi:hypothetical protein
MIRIPLHLTLEQGVCLENRQAKDHCSNKVGSSIEPDFLNAAGRIDALQRTRSALIRSATYIVAICQGLT